MTTTELQYVVRPGGGLTGNQRVPGDKSISHRSIILGSIADGTTEIRGILEGTDVLATIDAFSKMGVSIAGPDEGSVSIQGVGLDGLSPPEDELDLGNSGTGMRLLAGLLAGQKFASTLLGDDSLSRRPMRRVTDPLARMGAQVKTAPDGTPPLSIEPTGELKGIHYVLPVASAQVKSALLLAGLYANGETCIEEPLPTRDHTERMLKGFGYPLMQDVNRVCLNGGDVLHATQIDIPADLSSAAFFIVAATIVNGSRLRLSHVGINPTRAGLLDILDKMGAIIRIENEREICGEPVADLEIESAKLRGIEVPRAQISLAIDEFPILCVAAAYAEGLTVIRGAAELRHKESDRISSMIEGLRGLSIEVEEYPDGMSIRGGQVQGGTVSSHGDHRIAMAFCVAGAQAASGVAVQDCGNIITSFPGFLDIAKSCGMDIHVNH